MSEDQPKPGRVWIGFAIGAAMNIVLTGVMAAVVRIEILLACGVVQLLWIVPVYLYFKKEGATETAKGILIAAGVCFLLNASCWGLVFMISHAR